MNKWTMKFCKLIVKLDRIPRYGRLYTLNSAILKPEWRYQKHGLWGMNILDRLGLFWAFIDETDKD